jgi:hypothetical protein
MTGALLLVEPAGERDQDERRGMRQRRIAGQTKTEFLPRWASAVRR